MNGIDETTKEEKKMTYFPLHPHVALIYGNSLSRKAWNRIIVISEEDIAFWNKQYFKLAIEQTRFIYAKGKVLLEQLVKNE